MKLPLDIYAKLHQKGFELAQNDPTGLQEPEELSQLLRAVKDQDSLQLAASELLHYSERTDGSLEYTQNGLRTLIAPLSAPKTSSRGRALKKRLKKALGTRSQKTYIGANLTEGYSSYTPPSPSQIFLLDHLFTCMERLCAADALDRNKPTLVTLRRNILQLMLLPLTKQECRFNVVRMNGLIVLDFDWQHRATLGQETFRDHARLAYTGHRFEDVMTVPCEGYRAYHGIFQHEVGDVSVVLSAEIDASTPQNEYAELKTHTYRRNAAGSPSLAQKLAKTWGQNLLAGTDHAVVGFRAHSSHAYRLRAVKNYSTDEIAHSMSDTTTGLLRWYRCVVLWLAQETASSPQSVVVRRLEFAAGHLSLSEIDGNERALLVERLVPHWNRPPKQHCSG